MVDESGLPASQQDVRQVHFDYIKSQLFRTIRADGIIGGVTPNGHIHFAFFSERAAIPQRTVFRLEEGGGLGPEIQDQQVTRGGIVREMDVDVFITLEVASRLIEWLQQKVVEVTTRQKTDPEDRSAT